MNRIPEFGSVVKPTKRLRYEVAMDRLSKFYRTHALGFKGEVQVYRKICYIDDKFGKSGEFWKSV